MEVQLDLSKCFDELCHFLGIDDCSPTTEKTEKEWILTAQDFISACQSLSRIPSFRVYVLLDLGTCSPSILQSIPERVNTVVFGMERPTQAMERRRVRFVTGNDVVLEMSAFCGAMLDHWKKKGVLGVIVSENIGLRKDLIRQFSLWRILGAGFSYAEREFLERFLQGIVGE